MEELFTRLHVEQEWLIWTEGHRKNKWIAVGGKEGAGKPVPLQVLWSCPFMEAYPYC